MKKLLEKQRKLDDYIVKNLCKRVNKDITHKQLIEKRLLAMIAEIGEFTEENHEIKKRIEYADILHFLLSVGLTYDLLGSFEKHLFSKIYEAAEAGNYYEDLESLFIQISKFLNSYQKFKYWKVDNEPKISMEKHYICLFMTFLNLGKTMGYSATEIMDCYIEKNLENYKRQENSY